MKFWAWPFKQFTKLSFRKKITLSILFLSMQMILYMGLSSIQLSSDIILDASKRLSENNFEVVYNSLGNYFASVEKNSTLLLRMTSLRTILEEPNYYESGKIFDTRLLDASIREITNLASSTDKITFNTIGIYCKNGFNYNYFQGNIFPYKDYNSCIEYYITNNYINTGYKSSTWCDLIETYDTVGRTNYSFINLRMLYDPATLEEIGIIVTGIDENDLFNIYSGFSNSAYIMHKNGIIVSTKDKSLLGNPLTDNTIYKDVSESNKPMDTLNIKVGGKSQLLTYKKLASNNTYFIVPFDYYNGNELRGTKSFNLSMIILILIGIVTSFIFALILSKGLSKSVLSLKRTVKDVYKGNMNARFESKSNDEVSYLGDAINEMLDEINSLFLKQKEQENMNRTLELKLMQSQINPHLLYNTLDSALWALENKNISQTRNLIISLSSFFKITLSGGNDLIPIQKELELVNNYIAIQNTARNKSIVFKVNTTLPGLDFKIIKLSIQPIVENAILHGFSGYRDNGVITIDIRLKSESSEVSQMETIEVSKREAVEISTEETIQIVIEDNGIGIPDDELSSIRETLDVYPQKTEIRHFGLYNVQRRIKNLFGNDYGICLESEVGNYTRVTISIPFIKL